MNPLVAAWVDAITAFQSTVDDIPDADFAAPSLLAGWTVGDIIAHTAALEAELAGHPLPQHEPDWDALPHAADLFSRYTEVGVDARRGWSPSQVRQELTAVIVERTDQLQSGPQEDDHLIRGIAGREMPFGQQMRMRCFDIVIHTIDLVDALQMPAPPLGAGAQVCIGQMAGALGYVWVKRAGAAPGQVLHFVVPDYVDAWVEVGPDGRGRTGQPGDATVTVTLPVELYLRLGAGRTGDASAVVVSGDATLGRALVAGLNVAP